jgi:hypothetical protein
MSMPILFADDACVLIAHANTIKLKTTINEVHRRVDDWFKKNLMSLNKYKTFYINFTAKIRYVKRYGRIWYNYIRC